MHKGSSLARYFIILGIVIAATFFIPLGPVADVIAGEAPPVKPLPAEASEVFDARAYAAEFGVNVREARRRLRAQNQMSGITDLLRRGSGKRFAGLWIEHRPEFRVVVSLVGKKSAPAGLVAALASSRTPMPVFFQIGAATSQADLLAVVRSSIPDFLAALPGLAGTDVDVRTGEIVLTVHAVGAAAEEAAKAKGVELAEQLGHPVRIDLIEAPEQNASVRGGANLSSCTSGFVVANSAGTRGVLTAGHCSNTLSYSDFDGTSTTTTFISEIFDADQDVQWHTTPQTEVPEFYADLTTSARVLTGRRLYSSTSVGNAVCHRGISSGYSCGTVDSVTYQPTFAGACGSVTCASTYIRVSGANLACANGDSGGPFFNGQTAFGTLKTVSSSGSAPGQCNYATYMSTDYISGLGVSLVYGP